MIHTRQEMAHSRMSAICASRTKRSIARGVDRVMALIDSSRPRRTAMSVTDFEIEEEDRELCEEHFCCRPCRECRQQAAIEQAEALKDQ